MYLSRGYRKRSELYHIQTERKKKGYVQKKWPGRTRKRQWEPVTTVAMFSIHLQGYGKC